jgi:hypothetical protein
LFKDIALRLKLSLDGGSGDAKSFGWFMLNEIIVVIFVTVYSENVMRLFGLFDLYVTIVFPREREILDGRRLVGGPAKAIGNAAKTTSYLV